MGCSVYLVFVKYLDYVRQTIHENLKNTAHAPSVQMQNVPESFYSGEKVSQEEKEPDLVQDNVVITSERYLDLKNK